MRKTFQGYFKGIFEAAETDGQEGHCIIALVHLAVFPMALLRFILDLLKPQGAARAQAGKKREVGWWPASPGFL